jgi:hypothetical protein
MIVDVEVPFEGEQLVVNSFVRPDSLWSARVSSNRFILTHDSLWYKMIENATVIVVDENGPVATLQHVSEGMYRAQNEKPEVGRHYTLQVSAPNYPSVEAKSIIPSATTIESVEIEKAFRDGDPTEIIKVKFTDNAATKDFYHIRLEKREEYYNPYGDDPDQISSVLSPHPDIISDNPQLNAQLVQVDGGLLVKDVLFNGKQTEVQIRMEYYYYPSYFAGLRVILRSVSEDYYNYMVTKDLQDRTGGDPFAQPVNAYNNVAKGFGIFAGLNSSTLEWINPEQPVITEFSPTSGQEGDVITITGQNFTNDFGQQTVDVKFNGPDGERIWVHWDQITDVTETQLKVVVPPGATTGKLMVSRGACASVSDVEFQVID